MKKGLGMRMVAILLFVIFLLFYLNETFVCDAGNSDMEPHFRFALNIPLVFELGLKQFEKEIPYGIIIAYPMWHLLFDVIYIILNKVMLGDMGGQRRYY